MHIFIRFALGVGTLLELAFLYWMLDAPYGEESAQRMLVGVVAVVLIAGAVIMTAVVVRSVSKESVRHAWSKPFVLQMALLALGGIVSLTAYSRWVFWNALASPAWEGVVVEKYESTNHNYPALAIRPSVGDTIRIEGISAELYSMVSLGDTVKKSEGAVAVDIYSKDGGESFMADLLE